MNTGKSCGRVFLMINKKIFVTRPLLPDFNVLMLLSKEIYKSKWLTNMGEKHNLLEKELTKELKVPHLCLLNNGTIALLTALRILDLPIGTEVITTPFTFAATPHSIVWNGLKPVFCDIEPNTMTIDADKIEELITPNTSAILAVHVYGFPCNVEKIEKIAKKYNLKVIYDAAHAFSTEINNRGIGTFGDMSAFSFHSTKLYNTIEGGCLTCNNENYFIRSKQLRDFGIVDENIVNDIGINGKMNEFQSAWGLLNLKIYKEEQAKRKIIKEFYDNSLAEIKGIITPKMPDNTTNSYQYYPIVVENDFPLTRDELCEKFNKQNIFPRKYFYPVCSDFECYKNVKGRENLPVTNDVKRKVMCLPYYGELNESDLETIVDIIKG